MKKFYIVEVDIAKKQEYIFSSNKLKEIIGASKIIQFVSEYLGGIILDKLKFELGEALIGKRAEFDFANNRLNGNILYSAGGNSTYIFKEKNSAKTFIKVFSTFVSKNFTGLELNMVYDVIDFDEENFVYFYENLLDKLNDKKLDYKKLQKYSVGMYKSCPRTGKPAGYEMYEDDAKKIISKEAIEKYLFHIYRILYTEKCKDVEGVLTPNLDSSILLENDKEIFKLYEEKYKDIDKFTRDIFPVVKVKLENNSNVELDLRSILKELNEKLSESKCKCELSKNFVLDKFFESDFSDDYRSSDIGKYFANTKKYISLVVADGNSMGKIFKKIESKIYNNEIKESIYVKNSMYISIKNLIACYVDCVYKNSFIETLKKFNDKYKEKITDKNDNILPIRPIIFAGDDISFMINSSYMLEFVNEFNKQILEKSFSEKLYELLDKCIEDNKLKQLSGPILFDILHEDSNFMKLSLGIGAVSMGYKYPYSVAIKKANENEQLAKKTLVEIKNKYKYILRKCYESLSENMDFEDIDKIISNISFFSFDIIRGEQYESKKDENIIQSYALSDFDINLDKLANDLRNEFKNEIPKYSDLYPYKLEHLIEKIRYISDSEDIGKSKLISMYRKSNISESELLDFIASKKIDKELYDSKKIIKSAIENMNLFNDLNWSGKNEN